MKQSESSVDHGNTTQKHFKRRHLSIDQVFKAKGAKKLVVEESVYSFKKSIKKKGSVQIETQNLTPFEPVTAEKLRLSKRKQNREGASVALQSQSPSHALLHINDSRMLLDQRLQGNMTMTESMFSKSRNQQAAYKTGQW